VPQMGDRLHPRPAPEIQGAIFSCSPGINSLNPGVFEGENAVFCYQIRDRRLYSTRLTAGVGQQTLQGGPVHVGTRITAVVVLRGQPGPSQPEAYPSRNIGLRQRRPPKR
jgi:hypothetical protein